MKTIKDIDIVGKKVLIRCDFNVPIKNNIITDDSRIIKSLKTIKYALKSASNVIIISHLGRIKSKEDLQNNSLKIVSDKLSSLLNEKVRFVSYDEDIESIISSNKIVLLENTRFFDLDGNKESGNDEELSKYYASFADVFINDAFGVLHRECASNNVAKYLPSAIGFLVKEEIDKLSELFNPERPFTLILGGSKVSDKIGIISSLIDKVDYLVIVGAMAFTFLKSLEIDVGDSIVDNEYIDYCKDLINKYKNKIILPKDIYISDSIDSNDKELVGVNNISKKGFDIGPSTIQNIKERINMSKTIFVNGPAGVFENPTFSYGTKELFTILSNLNAKIIIGGGDSASAAINFGFKDAFYHISTGGGASLEFIEGKNLPGLMSVGGSYEKI